MQNQREVYELIFTHHHYKKAIQNMFSHTGTQLDLRLDLCISEPDAHIVCNSRIIIHVIAS